jgi:pimeloyl-ACP methyl ester carboxylesterase
MPFTQADDGTRIAYESHGTGSLKVLLLHGWGGSSSYWRDLVSHLNLEGLHLIASSYRGHGDSDKPSAGYALDQFANDVLAVADTEGAQRSSGVRLTATDLSNHLACRHVTTLGERPLNTDFLADSLYRIGWLLWLGALSLWRARC